MSMKRRIFVTRTLTAATAVVAAGAGLLHPRAVLAAWPKEAFKANAVDGTLSALYGDAKPMESGDVTLKAPDIAENGAVVPITVDTSLADVESIAIIVENNPAPLAASFDLGKSAQGYVSTRIKMGKTSNVMAVVKAGGKLHQTTKEVKVTIGGCGG